MLLHGSHFEMLLLTPSSTVASAARAAVCVTAEDQQTTK